LPLSNGEVRAECDDAGGAFSVPTGGPSSLHPERKPASPTPRCTRRASASIITWAPLPPSERAVRGTAHQVCCRATGPACSDRPSTTCGPRGRWTAARLRTRFPPSGAFGPAKSGPWVPGRAAVARHRPRWASPRGIAPSPLARRLQRGCPTKRQGHGL